MEEKGPTRSARIDQPDRLELSRKAYKQFFARCFWSYEPDLVITEPEIPFIVRELRHNGYRIAAELSE